MTLEQLLGLIALGVKKGTSDLHFEVGCPPAFRLHGELLSARMEKLTASDTLLLAKHILGAEDPFFAGARHDVDRGFSIQGVSRFRASILRQRGSVGLVLRIIPFEVPTLADLHLPAILESVAGARSGLILVTGATGNGKSTTMAAMLNHVNRTQRSHIITIEEPIEFIFAMDQSIIIQREVGVDTSSFGSALKAALRQDPDVLMVGEMRDAETADTCLKAAETGHLVISTLHTQDVQRTIGRFVGMFPAEEQVSVRHRLAENILAVVSLRLVPRRDGGGLIPAVEVLLSTRSVQEAIRDPARSDTLVTLMEKGRTDVGMQTFDQHVLQLVQTGVISSDTARSAATRPKELERALAGVQ
ncbi:type IV pilus twitching motility protein PilT [Hyalangium rubrum]|uniref:PilT/PilU family type 4a pilus ATPase n=1 Tax=Hyalangium rubrum TaxID=3103134 RepID=A0ABU5HBA6_9BACT|nr:PilT/PilU family type 4a pilus ATPase [Hyalangium sp. s54d21]MDY7230606.1 PilT/PilU family type 4a pilus ATPase [Hyalangium sp. s54d21]